jgi:hypothetical protein
MWLVIFDDKERIALNRYKLFLHIPKKSHRRRSDAERLALNFELVFLAKKK